MSNVKISARGKDLLRSAFSSEVARAIVQEGDKLSQNEVITIKLQNGRQIKLRSASAIAESKENRTA